MDNFYTYRDRYPNIKDFMPQLIAFFNYTASQFDIVYREYKIAVHLLQISIRHTERILPTLMKL